jgi:hypothetical protein
MAYVPYILLFGAAVMVAVTALISMSAYKDDRR